MSQLNLYAADDPDSDLVVDYKKTDVLKVLPRRSINFVIDTTGTGLSLVSLPPPVPFCLTDLSASASL